MPDPLVSIVISSFNSEKFLTTAIESALSQTYQNIEVVVVDDGSTDGSQTIIRRFGNAVRAVYQFNQCSTAAFNKGFAASSGTIVLFLDADDVLFPATVRQIMEAWVEGTIKVQYRLELIDDEGKSKGAAFPRYPKNFTPKVLHRDFLTTGNYPWPAKSGNAYDRSFLAKILPFSTEGVINTVAPLFGEIISLPRPLACYRIPGSNQRASFSAIPARFLNHIAQKEREATHLRQHAQSMGVELPLGNLAERSQTYVEIRLCASKLAQPGANSIPQDDLLRLCYFALR
jgi:hypothetical protein